MNEVKEADALASVATLAQDGTRMMLLVGKVKSIRRAVNKDSGEVNVYGEIICGEGETLQVTFENTDPAALPASKVEGWFDVYPRMFKGAISGFICTAWGK
jgi:hypothetical protein